MNLEKGRYKIIDERIYGDDQWFKAGDILEYIIIDTEYDDCKFRHIYLRIAYISNDGYIKFERVGYTRPIHCNVSNIFEMVKYKSNDDNCGCGDNDSDEEDETNKPQIKISVMTAVKYEETFINPGELELPNPPVDDETEDDTQEPDDNETEEPELPDTDDNETEEPDTDGNEGEKEEIEGEPNQTRMVEMYSAILLIDDIIELEWKCTFNPKTILNQTGKIKEITDNSLVIDCSKEYESKQYDVPFNNILKLRKPEVIIMPRER